MIRMRLGERFPAPGEWTPVVLGQVRSAMICCPSCRMRTPLTMHHEITTWGQVTPAFACPTDGCGFTEYIELVGWRP